MTAPTHSNATPAAIISGVFPAPVFGMALAADGDVELPAAAAAAPLAAAGLPLPAAAVVDVARLDEHTIVDVVDDRGVVELVEDDEDDEDEDEVDSVDDVVASTNEGVVEVHGTSVVLVPPAGADVLEVLDVLDELEVDDVLDELELLELLELDDDDEDEDVVVDAGARVHVKPVGSVLDTVKVTLLDQ